MELEEEDLGENDYEKEFREFIDLSDRTCGEIAEYLKGKSIYLLFDYISLRYLVNLIDVRRVKLVKVSDPNGYVVVFDGDDDGLFTELVSRVFHSFKEFNHHMVLEEGLDMFYLYSFDKWKIIEWCEKY